LELERRIILVADDFGLSSEHNRAIVECHRAGSLHSVALLVNAPCTEEAIHLAKSCPDLELGLHLGFVEGYSLLGRHSSVSTQKPYFKDGICLHANWQEFLWRWLCRKISVADLKEEFELQIEFFQRKVGAIAFLNSTQHLHMFPTLFQIVLELAHKYKVPYVRITNPTSSQGLKGILMRKLAAMSRKMSTTKAVVHPDIALGFPGPIPRDFNKLSQVLSQNWTGLMEIIMHPSFEAASLRQCLPKNYGTFDWEGDRQLLMAPEFLELLKAHGQVVRRTSDL
jgi:predicted glycoside hydrolase/deacetylase ChbG (UPF0249 family)